MIIGSNVRQSIERMVQIKTLPLLQDARFIVIDEGVEVLRATDLVAGWLQMWKDTGTDHSSDLLLFSDPKFTFDHWTELFGEQNLTIHDYYTQDLDNIYKPESIDLRAILRRFSSERKSTVIVNCLSSLVLSVGLAEAARFIEKLGSQVSQLICIYRRDFGLHRIPSIETLGSSYVRLDRSSESSGCDINYEVSVTHRKPGGGLLRHHVVISQDILTYEIKSERLPVVQPPKNAETSPAVALKPQATFRLDMNSRELEQKSDTPLPYIINNTSNPVNESKILYVPDDVDDLDEEDPDDDLPF